MNSLPKAVFFILNNFFIQFAFLIERQLLSDYNAGSQKILYLEMKIIQKI